MVVDAASLIKSAKILCIKIGSSLLLDEQGLRGDWIDQLAADIVLLRKQGTQVVLVSSGAVSAARGRTVQDGETLVRKQALAAVGQPRLMMAYAEAFDQQQTEIAQVLINPLDTEDRRRHLNVRGTLEELLNCGVVPIINENDTVSSKALRYGDNDRLSARVAGMINADVLLMLSDIDGLYTGAPDQDPTAKLIPWLDRITPEDYARAGGTSSVYGTGGMRTKLQAAEMCLNSNCHMIIASGKEDHALEKVCSGVPCTVFEAKGAPIQARKRWLSGLLTPNGQVIIDAGAAQAVLAGKSLLSAGVSGYDGAFERGDAVAIVDQAGKVMGHGLMNYSAAELELIKGCKSAEIVMKLGFVRESTVIHRDNFMLKD